MAATQDRFPIDDEHGDNEDHDDEFQGCYVYVPNNAPDKDYQRPSKKRKTTQVATPPNDEIFIPLSNTLDGALNARAREQAFEKCQTEFNDRLAPFKEAADDRLLENVVQFVKGASVRKRDRRLRTALIEFGPNGGSQTHLLSRLNAEQKEQKVTSVVQLGVSHMPNITVALRNLIRAAIVQVDGVDGYQRFLDERKRRIQMIYDLELLREFVTERHIKGCAVVLTEVELFDNGLLQELIGLLYSWNDRIPFVLLLGISTTVPLFEARLPKSCIRILDCRLFDASNREEPCSQITAAFRTRISSTIPTFGPATGNVLQDMAVDHDVGPTTFGRAINYAVMSHYFANPLSSMLNYRPRQSVDDHGLCKVIRRTSSFREYVDNELNLGNQQAPLELLNDDDKVMQFAKDAIERGQLAMDGHNIALNIFLVLINFVDPANQSPDISSLQFQALKWSQFQESPTYTDTLRTITQIPSDHLRALLMKLDENPERHPLDLKLHLQDLEKVVGSKTEIPIRSAHDPSRPTTSTTVTDNKISLTKQALKLTPKEERYTRVVDDFHATLVDFFNNHFVNPTDLVLHEAFVYDLKSPLSLAFSPRPRSVIERALSRPHDYLGCECCGRYGLEDGSREPPTSVLWRLWCEAGGIVNVRDLWDAFRAVIARVLRQKRRDDVVEKDEEEDIEDGALDGGDESEDQDANEDTNGTGQVSDERMALALFYRGLAELRMMGFVKPTKRKVDCLAKTAWRGL